MDDKRIGVLFVHGIGEQKRGATLEEFGGSMRESMCELLGPTHVTWTDRAAHGEDDPVTADLRIVHDGRTLHVLAAESWWADTVSPPSYSSLLYWLFAAVPFVIQRALDVGTRRSTAEIDRRRPRSGSPADQVRGATRWPRLVYFALLRIMQNLVGVALTLVVWTVLVVLGLVAVPWLRSGVFGSRRAFVPLWIAGMIGILLSGLLFVLPAVYVASSIVLFWLVLALPFSRRLQATIVGYIGDSYALLGTPKLAANGMLARIRRDLAWLEARNPAAPVAIVAHSQGAELVRRVLRDRPRGQPVSSLITFGSGIVKLDAVDRLSERPGLSYVAFGLRALSAAGVGLTAAFAAGYASPWWGVVGVAMAFGTLTIARRLLRFIVGEAFDHDRLEINREYEQVKRWTDLYASRDPVPEGPLPVGAPLGFSREIVNTRSILLDHISYWRNVEAFRSAVAIELALTAGWYRGPEHPTEVKAAVCSRDDDVKLLVWANALLVVATVAASVFLGRPVGELIARLAGGISRDGEAFMLAGSRPPLTAAIVFVALAIAFALLISKLWAAWSRQRTTHWLAGLRLQ